MRLRRIANTEKGHASIKHGDWIYIACDKTQIINYHGDFMRFAQADLFPHEVTGIWLNDHGVQICVPVEKIDYMARRKRA